MNDYTTPRRRPAVPGPGYPSQGGIAARAVALREEKERSEVRLPEAAYNAKSTVAEHAPQETIRDVMRSVMRPGPVGKLTGAVASVMSEIGTIPKTGYNKFHNYHYATLPDLLFVLTPLMGKHGIAVFQSEVEIKTIENRMAVTYDFTVAHSSGETWPEKLRFTGMSIGRDSKGSWDDKAVNKCHSAARKYFLLALFQVPTGDFEDGDAGPVETKEKHIVPGPDAPTTEACSSAASSTHRGRERRQAAAQAHARCRRGRSVLDRDLYQRPQNGQYPGGAGAVGRTQCQCAEQASDRI